MSPREKKPPVKPETRQKWLQRNEDGQSPPKIAAAYQVDPRTVRKHIQIAKQETETKEARSSVLRSALERHYDDLCRYAERLVRQPSSTRISIDNWSASSNEVSLYEPQLASALRQHIPRAPIWSLLNQETKLQTAKTELIKQLETKVEKNVTSDPTLQNNLTPEENAVIPGLIAALTAQAQQWVHGWSSLNVRDNLKSNPVENGFVDLSYGAYNMGKVRTNHVEFVRRAIVDWPAHIKAWEEFTGLENTELDLKRVQKKLVNELAVIALRRVVPGRCRFCPL